MVPFREALAVWLRIAVQSFGGPAGQIAVMHRILVEEKQWLSERKFLHALNHCMLLPGPEAMQLVTYAGWMLHGVRGGLVAGTLFVLPGFLSILALSYAYVAYAETTWLSAAFLGLKAAVLALVIQAAWRLGRRALTNGVAFVIAAGAFVAMFAFDVPFPLVLAVAALIAWRWGPTPETESQAPPGDWRASARTLAVALAIWWAPVVLLIAWLGASHILVDQGVFFAKAAVVTFGGAYAVLSYIAEQAVASGWLTAPQMVDGLGMAESTPGPLIQVVQFVGFMGAFGDPLPFSPWLAALLASGLVTWMTFVPSFLFIFAGAPHMDWLASRPKLARAMTGVTAAVVGVIVNLAAFFGTLVLWPDARQMTTGLVEVLVPSGPMDWVALTLAAGAFVALLRKVPLAWVLGGSVAIALLV
ncbi:MAG: chromate efflux transporter [Thermoplasmatota archaeon]